MAVITKEELLNTVKARLGEAPDDDGIALLDNLEDTLSDYEGRINYDWESERQELINRYEENDKMWRTKYSERFGQGISSDEKSDIDPIVDDVQIEEEATEITYDDLFNGEEK